MKPQSPYEQLLPLPTPCFKMFLKRSLMTPTPHHPTSSIVHCYPPSPFTTPPPPKNFDHTHSEAVIFWHYLFSYLLVVLLFLAVGDDILPLGHEFAFVLFCVFRFILVIMCRNLLSFLSTIVKKTGTILLRG